MSLALALIATALTVATASTVPVAIATAVVVFEVENRNLLMQHSLLSLSLSTPVFHQTFVPHFIEIHGQWTNFT